MYQINYIFLHYIFTNKFKYLVMRRYYLTKVHADFCPTLYLSAYNLDRLLDLCSAKGIEVSILSTLKLNSSPDFDGRLYNHLITTISKI